MFGSARAAAIVAAAAFAGNGLAGPAGAADATAPVARSVVLLPLAQPLWSELPPAQRKILAPLEAQWNAMPLAKKRSWIALATRLPQMEQAQREKAQERIIEWAGLTPEQRRQARNNYRLAQTLPKDARVATWEQYQQMTPEQRNVLRINGWTSNTAARHAGAPTGLAKQAARPLPGLVPPPIRNGAVTVEPVAAEPRQSAQEPTAAPSPSGSDSAINPPAGDSASGSGSALTADQAAAPSPSTTPTAAADAPASSTSSSTTRPQ